MAQLRIKAPNAHRLTRPRLPPGSTYISRCPSLYGRVEQWKLRSGDSVAIKMNAPALAHRQVGYRSGRPVLEDVDMDIKVMNMLQRHPHPHLAATHPLYNKLTGLATTAEQAVYNAHRPHLAVISKWYEGGDLLELIADHAKCDKRVDLDTCRRYVRQLAGALAHLHGLNFVHLDISPENIWLDGPPSAAGTPTNAVLSDYGLAWELTQDIPPSPGVLRGKYWYIAPELILHTAPVPAVDAKKADVYSLGHTIFVLLSSQMAYHHAVESKDAGFAHVMRGQLRDLVCERGLEHRFAGGALELVSAMMSKDPAARPTMSQVLTHPWLCDSTLKSKTGSGAGASAMSSAARPSSTGLVGADLAPPVEPATTVAQSQPLVDTFAARGDTGGDVHQDVVQRGTGDVNMGGAQPPPSQQSVPASTTPVYEDECMAAFQWGALEGEGCCDNGAPSPNSGVNNDMDMV